MRVLIFTEAGFTSGLGHLSRCISLLKEVSSRSIAVELVVNGEVQGYSILNNINYININWLDINFLSEYITNKDYVIIDSYLSNIEVLEYIKEHSYKTLYIDDFGRIEYPEGIIINPSLDISNIKYSVARSEKIYAGPKYIIVRIPFRTFKSRVYNDKVKNILISMGGSDIRELTPIVLKEILKEYTCAKIDVVTNNTRVSNALKNVNSHNTVNVHCNIDDEQMSLLMQNCDLTVTAAGQTLYELISTKTPFIPIQIIDNQTNNTKALKIFNRNQVVLNFEEQNFLTKFRKELIKFKAYKHRVSQVNSYKNIIDGLGCKRIIDKLMEE